MKGSGSEHSTLGGKVGLHGIILLKALYMYTGDEQINEKTLERIIWSSLRTGDHSMNMFSFNRDTNDQTLLSML